MTLALVCAFAAGSVAASPDDSLASPGLGTLPLYAPAGEPKQVVLFISGDGGWKLGVIPMAERLRQEGALVAGIDIRALFRTFAAQSCAYPAGTLEELARAVELHRALQAYERPMLAGYSSGATLVYAALAAAPPETFAGAISLGFCPDLDVRTPPCRGAGLAFTRRKQGIGFDLAPRMLPVPWMVLQGDADQVCDPAVTRDFVARAGSRARLFELPVVGHGFGVSRRWEPAFVEAYGAIAAAGAQAAPPAPLPAAVADLQPVEVPSPSAGETFGVLLTGDGGWAAIDKAIAAALASRGIPVVGWSSLRYFWTPRTPEAAAQDLSRLVEHYGAAWKRDRVLLVGYSFGADVLPFLANRLPEATRRRVLGLGLLGLSDTASFSFHVTSWLGGGGDRKYPTAPEVDRGAAPVVCVSGSDERDSACAALRSPQVRRLELPGGHHFGGDYDRIAEALVALTRRPRTPAPSGRPASP